MAGEPASPLAGHCSSAREWSSLRLDGELSDLETALLARHLEACGPCRAFDEGLARTAVLIRATPAVEPSTHFRPPARVVAQPRRRRAALAAVAAAAALGALVGSLLERPVEPAQPTAPTQVSLLTRDITQLRQLPRPVPVQPDAPEHEPGQPPEGVI